MSSSPLVLHTLALASILAISLLVVAHGNNLYQEFDVAWGEDHAKFFNNGELLTITLDQTSGARIQSKNQYLYGRFDMHMKLVPNNSAGTVTTFYLSSDTSNHDEIDLEFLGNLSGQPYILHTNLFAQGMGNREQQFYLWFDPTANFHTYTALWNPINIIFFVDGIPIRVFKNNSASGIPYPSSQAMRVYASLWNGDEWATRGGLDKIDWSKAPFIASYENYTADACLWGDSNCGNPAWLYQQLDAAGLNNLSWVKSNYLVKDYCTDTNRFPQGFPPECSLNP
ncbi:xyloglucan endotransglucosylase protein 7-like [Typha latifolia]|uniref:xyloglucan endotransglucosylase protein 7-like n=1 Tax=Typha latifolia TaxID=4733 RepID=UPI003C2B7E02